MSQPERCAPATATCAAFSFALLNTAPPSTLTQNAHPSSPAPLASFILFQRHQYEYRPVALHRCLGTSCYVRDAENYCGAKTRTHSVEHCNEQHVSAHIVCQEWKRHQPRVSTCVSLQTLLRVAVVDGECPTRQRNSAHQAAYARPSQNRHGALDSSYRATSSCEASRRMVITAWHVGRGQRPHLRHHSGRCQCGGGATPRHRKSAPAVVPRALHEHRQLLAFNGDKRRRTCVFGLFMSRWPPGPADDITNICLVVPTYSLHRCSRACCRLWYGCP